MVLALTNALIGGQNGGGLVQVRPQDVARLRLAQAAQDQDYSNIKSPLEGLAHALTQMVGAKIQGDYNKDTEARQKDAASTLAQAISQGQGSAAGLDPNSGITWDQARAPNQTAMEQTLLQNPDTAQMGQNMALQKIQEDNDPLRKLQIASAQESLNNSRSTAADREATRADKQERDKKLQGIFQDPELRKDPKALAAALAGVDPETYADDYLKQFPASNDKPVIQSVDPDKTVISIDPATGKATEVYKGQPAAGGAVGITKPTEGSEKDRRLAQEALTRIGEVEGKIFDDKGGLNRSNLVATSVGKGRSIDQALTAAIQNTLYLKTGQSAPDAEVERNRKIYTPTVADTDEQARNKINALKQFLNDAVPAYARNAQGGATDLKSKYGLE